MHNGETAFGFEQLVASTSAQGVTYESNGQTAVRLVIYVETDIIRYRYDPLAATALSSTNGPQGQVGDTIRVEGATNIKNFRFIRDSGASSNAVLNVTREAR